MNKGQQMFHDFYMSIVPEDNKQKAEKLLQQSFEMQDEGKFDKDYFKSVEKKYFELIKPEFIEKLQEAMKSFAEHMK